MPHIPQEQSDLAIYESEGEEIVLCDGHAEQRRMGGQEVAFVDLARTEESCLDCLAETITMMQEAQRDPVCYARAVFLRNWYAGIHTSQMEEEIDYRLYMDGFIDALSATTPLPPLSFEQRAAIFDFASILFGLETDPARQQAFTNDIPALVQLSWLSPLFSDIQSDLQEELSRYLER